jgi:hypothetical protein
VTASHARSGHKKSLQGHGDPDGSATSQEMLSPPPTHRDCEQQQRRSCTSLDGRFNEGVVGREGVAAPVPNSKQPESKPDRGQRYDHPNHCREAGTQPMEGNDENGEEGRVGVGRITVEGVRGHAGENVEAARKNVARS